MSTEWIGMTPRARLLMLFDAAYDSRCDLVIWEHDEPDAPAAFAAWLTVRGIEVVRRPINLDSSDAMIDLPQPHCGHIQVYLVRRTAVAA